MTVRLPSRQVHLDFHTSEAIEGVGRAFDKRQFQDCLRLGCVNSITVFAKCHHGWCYYPSKIGSRHPTLERDLTGEMIDAAHEIGVRAPVYITVGWSARDAERHPEWAARDRQGQPVHRIPPATGKPDEPRPYVSWTFLCPGSGYEEHVYGITREICERYSQLDGLFFDINFRPKVCFCSGCLEGMKRQMLDPDSPADAQQYNIFKWQRFCRTCSAILMERHPGATVFFNGGANMYETVYHNIPTHFEMEDLPTTWGGYDKMPMRARFFRRYGKDYLGMTGKFHTSWGEFGGFKNPEALRYECAWMLANGARCSVGDQMHPVGTMDPETYRLIGHAYRYVREIEPWCFDATETTDLGVFLAGEDQRGSDEGPTKILLESQMDFDVVAPGDDLSRLNVVILPDAIPVDGILQVQLQAFVARGGRLLLTGRSGLAPDGSRFALDIGADYIGPPLFKNDYVAVRPDLSRELISSPVIFYEGGERVRLKGGQVLAALHEPYFDRTFARYCSHRNTPPRPEPAENPAAIRNGNLVWLAHPVCRLYYEHGMQFYRDYFMAALRLIRGKPVLRANLPSAGRSRLVHQPRENRYVLHLAYASPIQRGCASVLEDMPPLQNVKIAIRLKEKLRRAYLVPQRLDLAFEEKEGDVFLTVPEVNGHQVVSLDYG